MDYLNYVETLFHTSYFAGIRYSYAVIIINSVKTLLIVTTLPDKT